jgi:T5SS/PEP-CTERM-associated repeat protein
MTHLGHAPSGLRGDHHQAGSPIPPRTRAVSTRRAASAGEDRRFDVDGEAALMKMTAGWKRLFFVRSVAPATVGLVFAGLAGPAAGDIIGSGSFSPPDLATAPTTSNVEIGGAAGSSQDGSLVITGGSILRSVNPSPYGNIGVSPGTTGTTAVTGAGSEWRLEGRDPDGFGAFLTVGRNGIGLLDIADGGRVVVTDLDGLSNRPLSNDQAGFQVGRNAGSDGTVVISGAGSELLVDSAFGVGWIGRRSDGTMNIVDGGRLTFSGINTDLNVASDLDDLTAARGVLNVNTGGQVTGPVFLNVGAQPGSVGTVNLDGVGSMIALSGSCVAPCPESFADLDNGAFLSVGADRGTGFVNVTNGAVLSIDSTAAPGAEFPGFSLGGDRVLGTMGDGTMTVDGPGSTLLVEGDRPFFSVGRLENGTGALNIVNGGQVIMSDTVANDHGAIGFVGDRPGATGTVVIDGAGSLLDAGSFLGVGVDSRDPAVDAGNGTVMLRNEGALKVNNIVVGAGGTIAGNGSIMGSSAPNTTVVQDRGTIAPGLSAGALSFDGDLILDGGILLLEAFGPDELDRVSIAGDLVLRGGIIEVVLGFAPNPFEPLQLIDVEDVVIENGGLDMFRVRALAGSGLSRDASVLIGIGSQTFEANVTHAAIPLPAPLWMMIAAFGGLGLLWRGRHRHIA